MTTDLFDQIVELLKSEGSFQFYEVLKTINPENY